MLREVLFAVTLIVAGVCVGVGVTLIFPPATWLYAGVALGVFGWLVLGDVR